MDTVLHKVPANRPTHLATTLLAATTMALLVLVACSSQQTNPQAEQLLVFQHLDDKEWRIYTVKPDGTDLNLVVETDPGTLEWLSPDGQQLAIRDFAATLNVVDILTSEVTRYDVIVGQTVSEGIPYYENLAWSWDGTHLAFLRDSAEGQVDVSVYSLETRQVTHLTHTKQPERALAWSPDSQQLAFATCSTSPNCPSADGFWSIVVVDRDGSNPHTIIDMCDSGLQRNDLYPENRLLCNLVWSPDGKSVVFKDGCAAYSASISYGEIFVAATDGSGVQQLTNLSERGSLSIMGYVFRWSPSGDTLFIAYAKHPFGFPEPDQVYRAGVLVINGKTFSVTDDMSAPSNVLGYPVGWSPDGQIMVWHPLAQRPPVPYVFTEPVDSQLTLLDVPAGLLHSACSHSLRWSLNNEFVAYATSEGDCGWSTSCRNGQCDIIVVSTTSGKEVNVTGALGGVNFPIGWLEK